MKTWDKRKAAVFLALLVALAMMASLVGCGAAGDSYAAAPPAASAPAAAVDEMYGADTAALGSAEAGGGDAGLTAGGPTLTQPADGRMVILQADLTIEALEFDKTCNALMQAAERMGGYVASTQLDKGEGAGRQTANFTVKVPAERYTAFLGEADAAGNVMSRNEASEDVTQQYVDVEARLTSLRAEEARLLELMGQAGSLQDLLVLQNRLSEVQYQIESYTATKRSLDNLVAYSTVHIYVYEVRQFSEVPPETYTSRIADAFKESWHNAGVFFQDLSIGLLYVLPGLLAAGAVALIVAVLVRRGAKKRKSAKILQGQGTAMPTAQGHPQQADANAADAGENPRGV